MTDEKEVHLSSSDEPDLPRKQNRKSETSDVRSEEPTNTLHENGLSYRSFLDAANDAIFIYGREGRFLEVNRAACRRLKYSREELLNKGPADICSQSHVTLAWNQTELTFRKGRLIFDIDHLAGDGHVIPTEISAQVFTYHDKPAIMSIARDISRRKKEEEALRLERDLAESLIDTAHAIIMVLDRHGRVLRINRYFEELTGWRSENARNLNWIDTFVPPREQPRIRTLFERALHEASSKGVINPILTKGGGERYIRWYDTVLSDASGRMNGLLCMGQDITDLIKAQEELKKARQELELRVEERTSALARSNRDLELEIASRREAEEKLKASLKEKDFLLQEIHHRAKNNMQIISSLLNLQAERVEDPVLKSMIVDSHRRVNAMAMAHDALCYTESMAEVDLKGYIENLTHALFEAHSAQDRGVELVLNCEALEIGVDLAVILGLIITELVTNSFKYAFSGVEKGRMTVEARETADGELELIVADNGTGIPETPVPEKSKSLGLKLVIGMVERQLGGVVKLQNEQGARFTMTVGKEAYRKRYLPPREDR